MGKEIIFIDEAPLMFAKEQCQCDIIQTIYNHRESIRKNTYQWWMPISNKPEKCKVCIEKDKGKLE